MEAGYPDDAVADDTDDGNGLVVTSQNAAATVLINSPAIVHGLKTYSFAFDPQTLGSTLVKVTFTGGAWGGVPNVFSMGCPGQQLGANGGFPTTNVTFSVGSIGQGSIGYCAADAYLDGAYFAHFLVNTGGAPVNYYAVLTKTGPSYYAHQISYQNFGCSTGATNIGTGVSYTDGAGTHPLGQMGSLPTGFVVQ
jgi:hypothetical protein